MAKAPFLFRKQMVKWRKIGHQSWDIWEPARQLLFCIGRKTREKRKGRYGSDEI